MEKWVFIVGELFALRKLEAGLCIVPSRRNPGDVYVCKVDRGWKTKCKNRSGGGNFDPFTLVDIQVL